MRYQNQTKRTMRNWTWNQLAKRIPNKDDRRKARVYCLIGDTTEDLETAEKKDFSRHNVVGVDIDTKKVQQWRDAGGLAIQAPLEVVLAYSKIQFLTVLLKL